MPFLGRRPEREWELTVGKSAAMDGILTGLWRDPVQAPCLALSRGPIVEEKRAGKWTAGTGGSLGKVEAALLLNLIAHRY